MPNIVLGSLELLFLREERGHTQLTHKAIKVIEMVVMLWKKKR